MKLSKLLADRTKEAPSDAFMKNHILLSRAGYIKQVANGIYSLSMLGQKASLNIENIIREEMDALDCQEVKFPVVMPRELWEQSGRYSSIGSEMARFTDRANRGLVLGMTHEEASVHLAKNWIKSYTQMPFCIYQIQTKFRDEPRARGGLIRVREFTMKDAYSFHATQESLEDTYNKMFSAYERIYKRIGLGHNVIAVKSDNGMFGGNVSHEFMYINENGEDEIVVCKDCKYCANQEVAEYRLNKQAQEELLEKELVLTENIKDISSLSSFLKVKEKKCIKAVVFAIKGEDGVVICFTRGDREINETKLRKLCKKEVYPFDASGVKGLVAGFIGPVGLKVSNARIYFDKSLDGSYNMVAGANKTNYHIKNVNLSRDVGNIDYVDISKAKSGDKCPVCGHELKVVNGIEIGNIFQLGTKYTQSMGMNVLNQDGQMINPIMGCYGIGVGRNLACVVEENCDEYGICMPLSVAPFKVHIAPIKYEEESVKSVADNIYTTLKSNGIDVLLDDRSATPGVKFADADLIGMPIRLVVSPRTLQNGQVELKIRKTGEIIMVDVKKAIQEILTLMKREDI